jgi:hypothetical protein
MVGGGVVLLLLLDFLVVVVQVDVEPIVVQLIEHRGVIVKHICIRVMPVAPSARRARPTGWRVQEVVLVQQGGRQVLLPAAPAAGSSSVRGGCGSFGFFLFEDRVGAGS